MVERLIVSEEQLADLRQKYPPPEYELLKVEGLQPGELVLRNPNEAEHHAFNNTYWGSEGEAGRPSAYRNALVLQCVFPDKPTLLQWLRRWPGLATHARVMRTLSYLSGQIDQIETKG